MTHLMHDGRKQIDVTRGRAKRIGVAPSGGNHMSEIRIRERTAVNEPAFSTGVAVNQYAIACSRAQILIGQIRDFKLKPVQGGNLIAGQSRGRPTCNRSSDNRLELWLCERRRN